MKSHPTDFAVDGLATLGSEVTPSFLTSTALKTLKALAIRTLYLPRFHIKTRAIPPFNLVRYFDPQVE